MGYAHNSQPSMTVKSQNKSFTTAPLARTALKDRVSELIKGAILSGQLAPGDRIVEMKVASDLGVATTSVREALFELESQGYVTRKVNKGTFVTQFSREDVEQILRVRRELEGLAAELLEQRATEEDIVNLRRIVGDMKAAAEGHDMERFYTCDLEFHHTIWARSGNRHLVKALEITVMPLFAFFIMRNPSDSFEELLKSVEWHSRVVEAISNKQDARRCMEEALQIFNQQENWLLFDRTTANEE